MKNKLSFLLVTICATVFLNLKVQAQDCNYDISNINLKSGGITNTLTFELQNAAGFEISVYNNLTNKYLLDNSNFQPIKSENNIKLESLGNRVTVYSLNKAIEKSAISIVLVTKNGECKPVKIDIK